MQKSSSMYVCNYILIYILSFQIISKYIITYPNKIMIFGSLDSSSWKENANPSESIICIRCDKTFHTSYFDVKLKTS